MSDIPSITPATYSFEDPSEETTKPAAAATTTAKPKAKAKGDAKKTDSIVYFEDWKPTAPGEEMLAFNEAYDHSELEFKKFRVDEISKLPKIGVAQSAYWQPCKQDTVLLGHKMSDVFAGVGDPRVPWDQTGHYPFGEGYRNPAGGEVREMYLAVRPMAAKEAELRKRAEISANSGLPSNAARADSLGSIGALEQRNPETGEVLMSSRPIRADGSREEIPAITSAGWGTSKR